MTDPKTLTAEREAFEKYFTAARLMRDGDTYKDVHADIWEGWQAALESRATREQTASTGEPVAWRYQSPSYERWQYQDQKPTWSKEWPAAEDTIVQPLYAAPVEQAGSTEKPFGWHRIESDGSESLQPMFVLGAKPPPYPAKYRPLFEQAGSPPLVNPAQPSDNESGKQWPATDLGATDEDALAIARAAKERPSSTKNPKD